MTCVVTAFLAALVLAPAVLPPKGAKIAAWVSMIVCFVLPAVEAVAVWSSGKGLVGAEQQSRSAEAYWGRGTAWWHGRRANHDFCEENYRYSPYVAEFHNTWSAAPVVFFGSAGIYYTRHYASLDKRYVFAFAALGAIGLGSVFFHATLLQWGQVLDEAPMMLVLTAFIYMLIEDGPQRRYGIWLPICLIGSCAAFMGAYLIFDIYWIFFVGFTGTAVVLMIVSLPRARKADPLPRLLFYSGVVCLVGGFLIWNIDNHLCAHVWFLRLHIVWHFGSGLGAYMFVMASLAWKCRILGQKVALVVPSLSGLVCVGSGRPRGAQLSLPSWDAPEWVPCSAPELVLPYIVVLDKSTAVPSKVE